MKPSSSPSENIKGFSVEPTFLLIVTPSFCPCAARQSCEPTYAATLIFLLSMIIPAALFASFDFSEAAVFFIAFSSKICKFRSKFECVTPFFRACAA